MPKSKKSLPDFKHRKASLTRKKPALNATDTSFKAKKILLPNQSLETQKTEPVTHRNQTIKELLVKAKHYSPNVRKDALVGMKELLNSHPELVPANFAAIFQVSIELIIDAEKAIRNAVLALYKVILSRVGKDGFRPYAMMYCKYLCAAMTHIADPIRLHAVDFANVLLQHHPQVIAEYHSQILPLYLDILSPDASSSTPAPGSGSTASTQSRSLRVNPTTKLASFESRHSILMSLNQILLTVKSQSEAGKKVDIVAPTLEWNHKTRSGASKHKPQPAKKEVLSLTASLNPNLQILDQGQKSDSTQTATTTFELNTLEKLSNFVFATLPVMFECWLECSPSEVLVGNCTEDILKCMQEILSIVYNLVEALTMFSDELPANYMEKHVKDFQKYIFVYFPFRVHVIRDQSLAPLITSINVLICKLSTLLLGTVKLGANPPAWLNHVLEFMTTVFLSEPSSLEFSVGSQLLSVLGSFLKHLQLRHLFGNLMDGFESYFSKSHPASAQKKQCLHLIEQLISDHIQKKLIRKEPLVGAEMIWRWIESLPRLLWQLRESSPDVSATTIKILQLALMGEKALEFGSGNLEKIQQYLLPLFYISSFSKKKQQSIQVYGPFIKLPPAVQRSLLEIYYFFPSISHETLKSWIHCFIVPTTTCDVISYALEILSHQQASTETIGYVSFFMSLPVISLNDLAKEMSFKDNAALMTNHRQALTNLCGRFLANQRLLYATDLIRILLEDFQKYIQSGPVQDIAQLKMQMISDVLLAMNHQYNGEGSAWNSCSVFPETLDYASNTIVGIIRSAQIQQISPPSWVAGLIEYLPGLYESLLQTIAGRLGAASSSNEAQIVLSFVLEWDAIRNKNNSHQILLENLLKLSEQYGTSSLLRTAFISLFGMVPQSF
eukprot:TRINITY_DN9059_c0_g1_i1.p1 TRINITY_DN9059_c0_g1~~TRINITY_DN9059_c0_g1_i1.p1  ORF type:complete len:895 (-),score=119.60 TRINITY_DN9059_c0_g1_i1:82-2766(-)